GTAFAVPREAVERATTHHSTSVHEPCVRAEVFRHTVQAVVEAPAAPRPVNFRAPEWARIRATEHVLRPGRTKLRLGVVHPPEHVPHVCRCHTIVKVALQLCAISEHKAGTRARTQV